MKEPGARKNVLLVVVFGLWAAVVSAAFFARSSAHLIQKLHEFGVL